MSSNEENNNQEDDPRNTEHEKGAIDRLLQSLWRSPLGVFGIGITTISITLIMIGTLIDMLGLIRNPYAALVTYTLLPGLMLFGLFLIPLAIYLQRRKWHKHGVDRDPIIINLSNPKHRVTMIGFLVLTVANLSILALISYEGYHFTDSPYFCGMVCHKVMAPEYTAFQRSNHSRVACVECHIGPGAEWYVKAKLSGLRQVVAVLKGTYHRPIPAPVHELRPARDTCEQCHWPEKFHGKKVKRYISFTNEDQKDPQVTEIALHIGGNNPVNNAIEGIHWHVSQQVEVSYLAVDEKRTKIAKVKVKRPDGTTDEFVNSSIEIPKGQEPQWRVMDCIDCHNRPTHVYDMPEERVDFGLLSKKINPDIPGIREDSLEVLTKDYASRAEAEDKMISDLLFLQKVRSAETAEKYRDDIVEAGTYLLNTYLGNVWPDMKVGWGTYPSHLGHQFADEGFGCWRCHDDEHQNKSGETISQDCGLCHDEPS